MFVGNVVLVRLVLVFPCLDKFASRLHDMTGIVEQVDASEEGDRWQYGSALDSTLKRLPNVSWPQRF